MADPGYPKTIPVYHKPSNLEGGSFERGSLGGEASKELFSIQAASFDDAVTEASASEPSSVGPSVGPISLHTGTHPHSPIVSIRLLSLGRGRPTNEDGAT